VPLRLETAIVDWHLADDGGHAPALGSARKAVPAAGFDVAAPVGGGPGQMVTITAMNSHGMLKALRVWCADEDIVQEVMRNGVTEDPGTPEAHAAATWILAVTARTDASQFTFERTGDYFAAAAKILGHAAGDFTAGQFRSYHGALASCIDAMPWQGKVVTVPDEPAARGDGQARSLPVPVAGADGKAQQTPVKQVSIHGASTNPIVRYAADVSGIDPGLLPRNLRAGIEPGPVTGWTEAAGNARVFLDSGRASLPAQVTTHNEWSAGTTAVALVADAHDPHPVTATSRRKPQLQARYRPVAPARDRGRVRPA